MSTIHHAAAVGGGIVPDPGTDGAAAGLALALLLVQPMKLRALSIAGLVMASLLASASPAGAGQWAALGAGVSVLKEEGHAVPLCCRERETWMAPGGRLSGQLGYAFSSPLAVRAEVGLALYQVAGQDHLSLRVLSPDAAAYVGGQLRREKLTLELAVGMGWRHFSGTAQDGWNGGEREVARHAADLRAALGLRAPLSTGRSLGLELMVAKVLIEQTVATASVTFGWQ